MQDEYANHVDAGGFTMPLIAETLRTANSLRSQFGKQENSTWDSMADNVLVLRENGITLEFTTMNGTATVKQADVILNTFPLSYTTNYTAQDSLNDLNYVGTTPTLLRDGDGDALLADTQPNASMPTSSRLMDRP